MPQYRWAFGLVGSTHGIDHQSLTLIGEGWRGGAMQALSKTDKAWEMRMW